MGDAVFRDFLEYVEPECREFAEEINASFGDAGYKLKMTPAKNGYVVSYEQPKPKRVAMNFVLRKKGLVARIYADNVNTYIDFLETLPESMKKDLAVAPDCKRLINPADCNSRCPMGYDYELGGERLKKCRYSAFMFVACDETMPFIRGIIEREVAARAV